MKEASVLDSVMDRASVIDRASVRERSVMDMVDRASGIDSDRQASVIVRSVMDIASVIDRAS